MSDDGRFHDPENAIYAKVAYRATSDVPYEIQEQMLASMRNLEQGLHYLLDNLDDPDLKLKDVAAHAGYSERYFKDEFVRHFEIPFWKFVSMLRMRRAAQDIREQHFPKDIAKRYGYADLSSFSKAFKREIGVSPRQFYKGNYAVPDMPMRKVLNGIELRLEYTIERALALRGSFAPPPQGEQTFLMDTLALPFTGVYPQLITDGYLGGRRI